MENLTPEQILNLVKSGQAEFKAQSQTEWWLLQDKNSGDFIQSINILGRATMTDDKNKAYKFVTDQDAVSCIYKSRYLKEGEWVIRSLKRGTITIDII